MLVAPLNAPHTLLTCEGELYETNSSKQTIDVIVWDIRASKVPREYQCEKKIFDVYC